ncbi:FAS1 domain-containing protein [Fusarium keratoplasticum]|uniref:FAS1 domain-containing protein n=1 Tax=Fusarium keratoplasticum TaxID=1328300 RepID=A0ACC0R6K4_9HYPO|nr:FAS1 domain-containing protein [Fusarium keratoplasticum]KAI8675733.1 FAS1 domain-containing protein [Fusarium keratoplasticum]
MRFYSVFLSALAASTSLCEVIDRQPLTFAPVPEDTYVVPASDTLLDFIQSREDLSILSSTLDQLGGFVQALNTSATWQYTFFAPSNKAFNNTGEYFETFAKTAKGKWWLGNLIQHHYVPNAKLKTSDFNSNTIRLQTSTYLYVSAKTVNEDLVLNSVATVTEGNLPVTNGIVHIIDRILDPSAQIFESDLPQVKQGFIPGSCSNPLLPYC